MPIIICCVYVLVSYTERSKQTCDKSFQNVSNLKYFGMTPTNQNCMHEEIKGMINSENVCYQSIQCGLHIFYQILLLLLYGCETWSPNIMGRMHMKLKYVWEKGAGETYFGLRGKKYYESGKILCDVQPHHLYSRPNTMRVIKYRMN